MEVQEQETELLSDEDFFLVERLTDELINKALNLCDEQISSFGALVESRGDSSQNGNKIFDDFVEKTRDCNKKPKLKSSPSENCIVRSNSVQVSLTFLQTLNEMEDYVTPGWRRSLRRTQSEVALPSVEEGFEIAYLEHFDPFRGSLDVVSDVDELLATSANKHPAEQTSFLQALEEISREPCISFRMTDKKPNNVLFDCASPERNIDIGDVNGRRSDVRFSCSASDEEDDLTDVDCDFSQKTQVTALREDGLAVSKKSQELSLQLPSNSSSAEFDTKDSNKFLATNFCDGQRKNNESCNIDSDIDHCRSINFQNSSEGTSHKSDKDIKLCSESSRKHGVLKSDSLNDAYCATDSDHRNNSSMTKSVMDEVTSLYQTNDRMTEDSFTDNCLRHNGFVNGEVRQDSSTDNCITSGSFESGQECVTDHCILAETDCAHSELKSFCRDTENVAETGRRTDLEAADPKLGRSVGLNDTVSDADGPLNSSFLSTDTDFSSFSAAEKFVREILNHSRSSSTVSSPRKSCRAAINADSRMYNTLTFLDNDDSDDGEGGTDHDRVSDGDRDKKTTTEDAEGSEKLDNHRQHGSDVNDNPSPTDEENATSAVLPTDSEPAKKKIVPNLELLKCDDLDLNFSPRGSVPDLHLGDYYNDHTPDDLDSPDDLSNPVFDTIDDWGDDLNDAPVEPIPEYTAREEYDDVWNWRPVQIGGISYRIDMRAIEPYKKVLSHGGYYGNGLNAIVVFAACYLPDRNRLDYRYIMDNLFLYVVSVLELLVVEDYMIIYFHAAASRNKVPTLRWLKRCYDMIDHRLRKNLQRLLVVHPTFFLKTVILMTKPFISSKFSSKLHYVRSLAELTRLVPTEYIHLPEEVKQVDRSLNPDTPAPQKKFINL